MFNKTDVRVLQPLDKSDGGPISSHSKGNSSKYDTEGELSDSRTLLALKNLNDDDFTQNYPAFRNKENRSQNGSAFKKVEKKEHDKQSVNSQSSLNSLASLKMNEVPEFDDKTNYYKLYWIAFMENQGLLDELRKLSEERNTHYRNMIKSNVSQCSQSQTEEKKEQRKKHNRR
mmetsp:Transcript_9214/g.8842  ORF Transcript_9214/g.8842 Transcript_9214/m.8842 type:complete len:173 (-) Transcript_9214:352-870(-)